MTELGIDVSRKDRRMVKWTVASWYNPRSSPATLRSDHAPVYPHGPGDDRGWECNHGVMGTGFGRHVVANASDGHMGHTGNNVGADQETFLVGTRASGRKNRTIVLSRKKVTAVMRRDAFCRPWLVNKATNRLCMAMADARKLQTIVPRLRRFGEQPMADRPIFAVSLLPNRYHHCDMATGIRVAGTDFCHGPPGAGGGVGRASPTRYRSLSPQRRARLILASRKGVFRSPSRNGKRQLQLYGFAQGFASLRS